MPIPPIGQRTQAPHGGRGWRAISSTGSTSACAGCTLSPASPGSARRSTSSCSTCRSSRRRSRRTRNAACTASYGRSTAAASINSQKYPTGPKGEPLSADLHWSKWEAYTTWLSGMALLAIIYWYGANAYLIDRSVMTLSVPAAIALSAGSLVAGWLVYDALCRIVKQRARARDRSFTSCSSPPRGGTAKSSAPARPTSTSAR